MQIGIILLCIATEIFLFSENDLTCENIQGFSLSRLQIILLGEVWFQYWKVFCLNPMQAVQEFVLFPLNRATYYRNTIIYKFFRICQGGDPPGRHFI